MGNVNVNGNSDTDTVIFSDEVNALRRAKRILAAKATDKEQSEYMRKACRDTLHSINNVIAQIVDEMGD